MQSGLVATCKLVWLLQTKWFGCYRPSRLVATCQKVWLLQAKWFGCYMPSGLIATCQGGLVATGQGGLVATGKVVWLLHAKWFGCYMQSGSKMSVSCFDRYQPSFLDFCRKNSFAVGPYLSSKKQNGARSPTVPLFRISPRNNSTGILRDSTSLGY